MLSSAGSLQILTKYHLKPVDVHKLHGACEAITNDGKTTTSELRVLPKP